MDFGDNVRVKDTPETSKRNLAWQIGRVNGWTTPSKTGVEVIGEQSEDFAFNVSFEHLDEDVWFAPDLLEFVDHGAGTTVTIHGVPKKWVRTETGDWVEYELPEPPKQVQ